jgi:hypothetical protein
MPTLHLALAVSLFALVPAFAAPPGTPATGTGAIIDPDFTPSTPPLATGATGGSIADQPGPSIRVIDSSTSAGMDGNDPLDLSKKVESEAQKAGLTLKSSGLRKLKELEATAKNVLSLKSDDPKKQAQVNKGMQIFSDAVIAEAKAHPEKPITAEFIQGILIKLCPLFPFCS